MYKPESTGAAEPGIYVPGPAPSDRRDPALRFLSPKQIRDYVLPPGMVLLGDNHVIIGECFVLGGAPGVGKSRAVIGLAMAGATGHEWFGLKPHRRFATVVLQAENSLVRLQDEFRDIGAIPGLEESFRICDIPRDGFDFGSAEFRAALHAAIKEVDAAMVIVDPFTEVARGDDTAEGYQSAFQHMRAALPCGGRTVALGIVAHTRKPRPEDTHKGRNLMHLLSGSYVLSSKPRSAFILSAATDEPEDDRVVFTCCKNNNGKLGAPSAWHRRNGLFVPAADFDWDEFNHRSASAPKVSEAHLREVFKSGVLGQAEAAQRLMVVAGVSRTTAYEALNPRGRNAALLQKSPAGLLFRGAAGAVSPDSSVPPPKCGGRTDAGGRR